MVQCVPLKEEEIQDISKELEVTIETIHLLREELSKTKVHIVHSLPAISFCFHCLLERLTPL